MCHVIHNFSLVFLWGIDLKSFQVLQGHVGHHGGCRHKGQGGVNQAVNEIILCHIIHHYGLVFDVKLIADDFKYLRD